MDRIIIAISELKKENWVIIYQFIKSIVYNENFTLKKEAFFSLKKIAIGVRLNSNLNPDSATDVYSLYGEDVLCDGIGALTTDTCFSILYQKDNENEDYTELVPFVLIQHEFGDAVSLGIDIGQLNQQNYVFKCSDFFILFNENKPKLGKRNLYFINGKKVDKETGLLETLRTRSFAGKGENESSRQKYEGEPSRKFLPLLKITESNYKTIFGIKGDNDSEEFRFVKEATNRIKKEWVGKKTLKAIWPKLNAIFDDLESPFGQWFESSYFYSYDKELKNLKSDEIEGIRNTLQIYKNSIKELVQNIIFHGGKEGLMYCVFDKKINIAENYQDNIPDFINYSDETHFLRIGIFDFGNSGIVDNYLNNKADNNDEDIDSPLSLRVFFDTNSIVTTGLTHLDLRYAARLGIKTFVKTIVENNGYFSVESNDQNIGRNGKKFLQTILKDNAIILGPEEEIEFVNGTHYEIVLPVIASENYSSKILPLQRTSLLADSYKQSFKYLSHEAPLNALMLSEQDFLNVDSSTSKSDQKLMIKSVGSKIIDNFFSIEGNRGYDEIVLNLDGIKKINPFLVFKIVAFLQLYSEHGFEKVILVNTTDCFVKEFCGLIHKIITSNSDSPVWSRDAAIIIISENLYTRIIWGETKDEFLYINQELQKLYCNDFFIARNNLAHKEWDELFLENSYNHNNIDENIVKKAYCFILPYDIMINIDKDRCLSLFESFMNRLLKRRIDPKGLGFSVNQDNTYIGNKIIVKNYYEADMIFQNNFFTERFAYLITRNIRHKLSAIYENDSNRIQKKKLLLIGYNQYSEILIKAIKNSLKDEDVYLTILKKEKDAFANDVFFDFDVDTRRNGEDIKTDILKHPDRFLFVTIVPIDYTLSTNDKTVAFFKQWFNRNSSKFLDNDSFIYNHCVIVVRDGETDVDVTERELEQKWVQICFSNHVITTCYNNAKEIYYTVQIGQAKDGNNWLRRLNDSISFPKNWWNEKHVNFTDNSFINLQNILGFPKVELDDEAIHEIELNRLYELRNDIYKGHIEVLNRHNKYYIDTERFVKRKKVVLEEWLRKCVRETGRFNQNNLNVIITPNVEIESDFVFEVNNIVFDGNALVVYLDVNNWRNNMVHKLSFLKDLHKGSVKYHYVDHAFHTGETFHKSKSYLFSIVEDKDTSFNSIITVVNHLSYAKNQEIKNEVLFNMYAFVNLHYPASREGGCECELCRSMSYYEELNKRTVLDSCLCAIKKNLDKLQIVNKNKLDRKKWTNRDFLRLVMAHEFYYRIAEIAIITNESYDYKQVYSVVKDELDGIYEQMSVYNHVDFQAFIPKSRINQKINDWMLPKLHDVSPDIYDKLKSCFCSKLEIDKRISFLKVISSPPLSQFIAIKNYAYEKLLHELYVMISKTKDEKNDFVYDDLKIIKSILKSLSFMKSNALVRKDVIVGVWRVLVKVIENIDREKEKLKENIDIMEVFVEDINERIQKTRQSQLLFSDSVEYLKNEKRLAKNLAYELDHDYKSMKTSLIIKDFSRDLQFFIKNATVKDEAKTIFLGELLKQGNEMSNFEKVGICKTILSLEKGEDKMVYCTNERKKITNDLFTIFSREESAREKSLFKKEYTDFLVSLFYDNTTIIRKTLDDFSNELLKDGECYDLYYNNRGNVLNDIVLFKNKLSVKKNVFEEKVEKEYYYSSFMPYLENGDNLDFIEKLLYVTYARLKLKDLISNKNKTFIENDTCDLMEIFSAIMGAESAFWTMKATNKGENVDKDFRIYPISLYDNDVHNQWNYDIWNLEDMYYTYQIYTCKKVKLPIVMNYSIKHIWGEKRDLQYQSLVLFPIFENIESERTNSRNGVVSCITFLYKDSNPLVANEMKFRTKVQEFGRMLLLLKNEIDEYAIGYLLRERVFDLWEKVHLCSRRFEKIYANSSHVFNSVYKEMEEFENLDEATIRKLSRTWFYLTNETISFLYSSIEKNPRHYLDINENLVVDRNNTLGQTFNDSFICILSALLSSRWKSGNDRFENVVYINDQPLVKFKIADELKDVRIHCNKYLIRTFIAQCLHNSFGTIGNHGHRYSNEVKRVDIFITISEIVIRDSCIIGIPGEVKAKDAKLFLRKKGYIRYLKCDEYSSTTLTSLQGVVDYLNYSCDYGYKNENNFEVSINYAI